MCRLQSRLQKGHFNCLSVGNKQSLCPLMWGAQEKSGGAHQKNFGRRQAPALCPHLQIASDATAVRLFVLFRRILLGTEVRRNFKLGRNVPLARSVFRLDALALSVIATATWLGSWVAGWLSHSGIVSTRLILSENFFDHPKAPSF